MKYYVMLFLLFLGMYIAPLSFRPMITPDEFRYAEIPREMVESGNWVKPRLAGMDYFEKPALGYQMTAVSFKIFGYNNFALRFPPALATGLTALLLVLFLRRYTRNDRIAVMGGVLYLDMGLVFALGNCAVLDAQVTLFLEPAVALFYTQVAKQAGVSLEQVLTDALFKLAGELSLEALQARQDTCI